VIIREMVESSKRGVLGEVAHSLSNIWEYSSPFWVKPLQNAAHPLHLYLI
jgi:hypothetical protein